MKIVFATLVCVFLGANASASPRSDSQVPAAALRNARQLFDSAQYVEALVVLDSADAAAASGPEAAQRAVYRALCLLALNRNAEAEAALAELITAQPLFRANDDVSPRVQSLVAAVADRMRPSLIRQHYRLGKQRFDAKEYAEAQNEFALVLQLIGAAADPAQFDDVKVLAEGFEQLAGQVLTPAAAAETAAPTNAGPAEPDPPRAAPVIVGPVAIRQDVPAWPSTVRTAPASDGLVGAVELVIGITGDVQSVKLVKRMHPVYDALLVAAAKKWKYEPATRGGQPIEYTKQIEIKVTPR
jgi:tetratricopeptide (TPR) repeat protein